MIEATAVAWFCCGDEASSAVMLTFRLCGREPGAVYLPEASTVPQAALPPGTPFTSQVSAPPDVEEAVNCCVWPGNSATYWGLMVTEPTLPATGGGCVGAACGGGG